MNKLIVLSLLAICISLVVGQGGARQRANRAGNLQQVLVDAESGPIEGRQARRRGQNAGNVQVEQQVFPGNGLNRRGNGARNAQRVIESQNVAGVETGVGEGAAAANSLRAGERNLDALQALIQQKDARQQRIDAKAERQARRSDKARASQGEKLQAQSALEFETYEEAEDFSQLDAAASKATENRFALSIQSENLAKEDAAISQSEGTRFASGTKLNARDSVDAETFANEEVELQEEAIDNQELSAADAAENLLNAQQEDRRENEAFIDSQNFQQFGRGFQSQQNAVGQQGAASNNGGFFGNNDFFGSSGFGSSFKKK